MKIFSILRHKCPHCEKGDIFEKEKGIRFSIPKMNKKCPSCGFPFHKETGFFYGAMYVSYALTVAQGMIWFGIGYFLLGLSLMTNFLIIAALALFLSRFNFKLSRTLWIYLFYSKPS